MTKVIVVPVFMTKGELYNSLKSRLDFYLDRLEIKMTDPVLHDATSCDEMCEVFEEICRIVPEREYLFVDHGNPSYGAEKEGLLASLNSVAKVPYEYALDGISNTQTISPGALGHTLQEQKDTLVSVMDGYFDKGAHHLNVNVFGTEKLV